MRDQIIADTLSPIDRYHGGDIVCSTNYLTTFGSDSSSVRTNQETDADFFFDSLLLALSSLGADELVLNYMRIKIRKLAHLARPDSLAKCPHEDSQNRR